MPLNFDGNRPKVKQIKYDAATQLTTVTIGNNSDPALSTEDVLFYQLKSFSELNYFFNALKDNVGAGNVAIIHEENADGLKDIIIGKNGTVNDGIQVVSIGNAANGLIGNDGTEPFNEISFDNFYTGFIRKDNEYFITGAIQQNGAFTVTEYDKDGNVLAVHYSIEQNPDFTVNANLAKLNITLQSIEIENQCAANDFIFSSTNLDSYFLLNHGTSNSNQWRKERNWIRLLKKDFTAGANVDVYFYKQGVQVASNINVATNGTNIIPATNQWDKVVIADHGTPPTPPTSDTMIVDTSMSGEAQINGLENFTTNTIAFPVGGGSILTGIHDPFAGGVVNVNMQGCVGGVTTKLFVLVNNIQVASNEDLHNGNLNTITIPALLNTDVIDFIITQTT